MEVKNIFKIILFLAASGASIISFKVVKDNNIAMPKNIIEIKAVSEKIVDKTPEAAEEIWQEDVVPVTQEMINWFSANVLPKAEDFLQEEVKSKVKEEIQKQAEEIQTKTTSTLSDIKGVITGEKKCRWICE